MCKVFDCDWRRLLIRSCLPHDALGLAWKLAPHSIQIWFEPIVISGYQPLPVPKTVTTVFSKCWLALCDVDLCCDWLFCLSPVWVSNANQRQKNKPELVVNANVTSYESLTFVNCVGLENFVLWTVYHLVPYNVINFFNRERAHRRRVKESVTQFSLLCRGLYGTAYAS